MTNIVLLCLVIYCGKATGDVTFKGYSFEGDRIWYPIGWWDWMLHEANPDSTWILDFKNFGNCARLNVKPFILPKKWTTCYKVNHRSAQAFTFLSLISSLSGNSVVDDFETTT